MTIEELIERYRTQISESNDKKSTTNKIIKDILSLKYSNGKDVPNSEKIRILEEISKQKVLEYYKFAQDNTQHLEVITATINKLKGANK